MQKTFSWIHKVDDLLAEPHLQSDHHGINGGHWMVSEILRFQLILMFFSKSGTFLITPWPRSWSGERYLPESWFLFILWIQGLGCDFALKSCKDWMESRARKGLSIHPYCNKVTIEIWSRKAYIVLLYLYIGTCIEGTQCFNSFFTHFTDPSQQCPLWHRHRHCIK